MSDERDADAYGILPGKLIMSAYAARFHTLEEAQKAALAMAQLHAVNVEVFQIIGAFKHESRWVPAESEAPTQSVWSMGTNGISPHYIEGVGFLGGGGDGSNTRNAVPVKPVYMTTSDPGDAPSISPSGCGRQLAPVEWRQRCGEAGIWDHPLCTECGGDKILASQESAP